jgi:hypothetical protein
MVKLRFESCLNGCFSDYNVYNANNNLHDFIGKYRQLSPLLGELPENINFKSEGFTLIFDNGKLSLPPVKNLTKEQVFSLHGVSVFNTRSEQFRVIGPALGDDNRIIVMSQCRILYSLAQSDLYFKPYGEDPIRSL